MRAITRFFTSLSPITRNLGICGNVGLIAGTVAGIILYLFYARNGGAPFITNRELFFIGLMLTVFTWMAVLFILVALIRMTFMSIALPSLVNCLFTCLLTTYLVTAYQLFPAAPFVGMIVGVLVGSILCRLYALLKPTKSE